MRIFRYFVYAFSLLFLTSDYVMASCNSSELKALKEASSKVKITYQYNEENEKLDEPVYGEFSLYITGLSNDIYLYDYASLANYYYGNTTDGVIFVSGISSGDRKIYVMSNNNNCKGKLIDTIVINIPKFNYYSVSTYCEGIDAKEFVYCDKWYQGDIIKANFINELNIYKAKKSNGEDISVIPDSNDNDNNNENSVYTFFLKYYLFIIGGVIIVCGVIVYLIYRKRKEEF